MLGHRALVPEDYFAILKRRWWIVLLPLLILPIVSYMFSYTVPPEYLSQTLVLVEGQKVPEGYVKPVLSEDLTSQLASMKEQILSRSRLQPILESYNLFSSLHDMDSRIELMRKNIEIRPIHSEVGNGLPGFFISFKASDPHVAQAVCTEITSMFTNENLRHREQSAEGTTEFLKGQLGNAKRNLDEQDAKLAQFQTKYMGRLPGEESSNSNMLGTLSTQLESANQDISRREQDRMMLQSMLAQATNTPVAGSSPSVVFPISNPELEAAQAQLQALQAQESDLLLHYTTDYPEVVSVRRKIADLRKKITQQASAPSGHTAGQGSVAVRESPAVQQLRSQLRADDLGIQEKRKEQAEIQASMRNYQSRLESTPEVEAQYKLLTRDHDMTQAAYNDLLNKLNTATMSTDLEKRQEGEHFQVMDAANLPDAPFSPKRPVFALTGGAFGLALGLIVAGLLEYRDTTLRSERDIWAFTNLPTLGVIPISNTPEMHPQRLWRRVTRLFRFGKLKVVAEAQS